MKGPWKPCDKEKDIITSRLKRIRNDNAKDITTTRIALTIFLKIAPSKLDNKRSDSESESALEISVGSTPPFPCYIVRIFSGIPGNEETESSPVYQ